MKINREVPILIADDDQDDILMLKELFAENNLVNPLYFVSNGVELLNFLKREGKFKSAETSPRPGIIMLSLNMPKMDGRTVLEAISSNKHIKDIPIVIMTSSTTESEIARSWKYEVHGYLPKPIRFNDLMQVVIKLSDHGISVEKIQ